VQTPELPAAQPKTPLRTQKKPSHCILHRGHRGHRGHARKSLSPNGFTVPGNRKSVPGGFPDRGQKRLFWACFHHFGAFSPSRSTAVVWPVAPGAQHAVGRAQVAQLGDTSRDGAYLHHVPTMLRAVRWRPDQRAPACTWRSCCRWTTSCRPSCNFNPATAGQCCGMCEPAIWPKEHRSSPETTAPTQAGRSVR
jgi:hypothetical protein